MVFRRVWGAGAAAKLSRSGLNYALTMDSSPGGALCLLYTRVVVIRARTSALVPWRFLKDVNVTITAFTLLDGRALRILKKPISNPDQAMGLNLNTMLWHVIKSRTQPCSFLFKFGLFPISLVANRVGFMWALYGSWSQISGDGGPARQPAVTPHVWVCTASSACRHE